MNALLERLGLGRRDLRAWALYDLANSAFQTTIIAAVFPIYYNRVVAQDLPGSHGHEPVRLGDDDRDSHRRRRRAAARRNRRLRGDEEEAAGGVHRHRRAGVGRDVLDRARRLDARAGALRDRQRRRRREHRVLRIAAAAPRLGGSARSRVVGRLRDRLPRRRHPARDQPADDSEARALRHSRCGRRHATHVRERRRLVGAVLDSAVSARAGARRDSSKPTSSPTASLVGTGLATPARDVSRAPALPAGLHHAAGLPPLQRRHPDDDPDGDDLRERDRAARERDDHGAPDDAVHRRAGSVRLRRHRRRNWREDRRSSAGSPSTASSRSSATT